jgi:hypothetical protein
MKKRLSVVSKTVTAVQAWGIGLLLLISCNNMLVPRIEGDATGNGETGMALISIGNGVEGARTLLPAEVSFDLYKLTIEAVLPNTAATVTKDISSGSSDTVALTPGDWKIHVDAYTDSGGTKKAAEGDSGTFTVSANATTGVPITLAAVSSGDPGTLSIDITGDSGAIYEGWLYIYDGAYFEDSIYFYNGSSNVSYMHFDSTGLTLDIPLSPGQYRICAEIFNNEDQKAYINEVAYIYSNLTTNLNRVIGAAAFSDMTTISGTVRYMENGIDQNPYDFLVYADFERSGNSLDGTGIWFSGEESYTLHIPRPDKNVTLYFFVYKNTWILADTISLVAEQVSATKNISVNHSSITLSGTATVTVDGNAPSHMTVYAFPEGGGSAFNSMISGDTWTMGGIPTDFSGTLNLYISAEYGGQFYAGVKVGSWTPGASTTGIALSAPFITVTGSFTATENSNPISGVFVYIEAYRESVPGSGSFNEHLGVTSGSWNETTCDWSFNTLGLSPAAQVQFNISMGDNRTTETITLGTSSVSIPLKTYAFTSLTLGGTIGTVTVNGDTPSAVYIYARTPSGDMYWISPDSGGNWQVSLPGDFSGTLTMVVQVEYQGSWHQKDVYTWTSGSSTTGITLGNVNITLTILSGVIGTVTVNGDTPSDVYIYAGTSGGDMYGASPDSDGNWQIHLPGDFSGTLTIMLEVEYQGSWHQKAVKTWTSGSTPTGISLGNFAITLSPIDGTVTTNGSSPLNAGLVYVLSQSASELSDLYDQIPVGSAEIIDGIFSGYVNSGVTSDYVLIVDFAGLGYFITPSPVTLGSSMSLNLSAMTMLSD